jgi:uncharacterized protein
MRLSKFNIKAVDAPEKGHTAVFNTLTRGIAVLESNVLEGIEKGDSSGLGPEEIKSLEDLGILVPERFDEDLFFDVYYNQVRFDNTSLRITLLTTLNCNFACPYCYEGDLTYGKKQMSGETAEDVISWIKKRAIEGRVSKIRLEYLGGEPLMNLPVIEKTGHELLNFCKENGIKFVSIIISNGYLLTKETAERVAAAGVESVRVTIDGPEEIHNSYRFLRGDGGKTYRTIIKNLQECKDILSLSICGTYTRETGEHIPMLLDDLTAAGLGPDVIHKVQFGPMMPSDTGGKAASFDKRCMDGVHDMIIKGNDELITRGFGNYAEPEFTPCPAVSSGDYTINYDGALYKCPCLVDHPGYEVGNVREEMRYNAEMVRCLGHNTFENKKCRNCNLLPLCLGGCRYMALVQKGNFHDLDCDRGGLEAITLETVRSMAKEL